jgi:hypothetical protein
MPITHWACPADKPTYGEAHTADFCITECQHKCVSPFLIAALTASNQKNHHKGKYISATSLSGCVRKLKSERTLNYAEYMANALYAYRGTVMHQVVEDAAGIRMPNGLVLAEVGYVTEWRMLIGFCFHHGGFEVAETVDVNDEATWDTVHCPLCVEQDVPAEERGWFLLGGTLDGLEPLWDQFDEEEGILYAILWDLKTMADYAITKFITGDDSASHHPNVKDGYVVQANIYKYLAERSIPPEILRKRGVKKIRFVESHIQAFGMSHFPRTGSTYRYKKHWKHELSDWEIPGIEFWADDQIEAFISEKGRPIYETLILDNDRGPICEPEGKGPEHSWECRFCAFYETAICPNPSVEWKALKKGATPEEAFAQAMATLET